MLLTFDSDEKRLSTLRVSKARNLNCLTTLEFERFFMIYGIEFTTNVSSEERTNSRLSRTNKKKRVNSACSPPLPSFTPPRGSFGTVSKLTVPCDVVVKTDCSHPSLKIVMSGLIEEKE